MTSPKPASELPAWCLRNREVLPDSAAPGSPDLAAILTRNSPRWEGAAGYTAYWGAGAPLGNGDFGALVYGSPDALTFLLGKNDMWIRATTKSYFPTPTFAELVDIVRRQDREAFARLQPGDPLWWDSYRPSSLIQAGTLTLHLTGAAVTKQMAQELRLQDATWTARFEAEGLDNMWSVPPDYELDAFASAPDEVLVIRIRRHRLPLRAFSWMLARATHQLLPPPETDANGTLGWLEQELLQGDRYAIAVLHAGSGVEITPARRSLIGESDEAPSGESLLFVAAATTADSADPLGLACERVTRAAGQGYAALHVRHAKTWGDFWPRSRFTCPTAPQVEKAWYVSNYLAGATMRPGRLSPGLQGMWCKENFPPWSADFHGNINIQAIYQGILGSNHMELLEPYAALYRRMRPQCRRDTEAYFGLPGVRYPHAGGVDGHELTEPNYLVLSTSYTPSSWIARVFWWAYQHTGDREYLAGTAYPFLKDVAEFYLGLLDRFGRDAGGRHRLEMTIWGEAHATTIDGYGVNSGYDVAAFHAAFEQAAAAAAILDVDPELRARCDAARAALPPLPVDAEGVWLMWPEHPKNSRVTAGSFFHSVFPCELASRYHGPEELRRQALDTWFKHARQTTSSPWCGGAPTAAAVRLGDTEWAWRSLLTGLPNNGLQSDLVAGLIQDDHGTGFSFGINCACVLAIEGTCILFPGIPPEVDAAFHSLRAPGALLVSAEQRGGAVVHAAVQSLRGGPLSILNPFRPAAGAAAGGVTVEIRGSDGSQEIRQALEHHAPVAWSAEAGVVYQLHAAPKRS